MGTPHQQRRENGAPRGDIYRGLGTVLLLAACAAPQKPAVEWADPGDNLCGPGDCVHSAQWSRPGPNPCPCPETEGRTLESAPAVGVAPVRPEPREPASLEAEAPPARPDGPKPCPAAVLFVSDIERKEILRMNLDGSGAVTVLSGVEANDLAVDSRSGVVYWTEADREIRRALLDGSRVETVVADVGKPYGIAFEPEAERVIWTNQHAALGIWSARASGAEVRQIVPSVIDFSIGIAVDAGTRALYWMDGYYGGRVMRSHIDGGNPEQIATTVGIANGIAIDGYHGRIYWTEYGNGPDHDVVRRANLDGTSVETLFDRSDGLSTPQHIDVDPREGKLYWTDLHAHRVLRANVDGTGLEVIRQGMGYPRGIALLFESECGLRGD